MRTDRQRTGDAAEGHVAEALSAAGWTIVARGLHVGRAEIDILAVDPGPPEWLVVVEVRYRRRSDFGRPEETVDRRKAVRLRRAAAALAAGATLADGALVPRLPLRLDLVAVEPPAPADMGRRFVIRHHRGVL